MRFNRRKGRQALRVCVAGSLFVATFLMGSSGTHAAPFVNPTSSSNITATVDPSFMFSVAGLNSGDCNGAPITGTGSSGSAVSLGRVDRTSAAVGGQTLTVASNAGSGYSVFARVDGPLNDGNGHTIATLANSHTAPGSFASPGTEAFGYTTSSPLQGGQSDRFYSGGAKWAGIDTSDRQVMFGASAVSEETRCIAYQITISKDTVGGFYGNNVTYTAVPSF